MQLTDEQIDRFARQIIVPGIGAVGQERLCTARVRVLGDPTGCRYLRAYARAVGMQVTESEADYQVLAATDAAPPSDARRPPPTAWYRLTTAGWLAGLGQPPATPAAAEVHCADDDGTAGREALHAAAAADAINTLVALVLGWESGGDTYEVRLA